MTQKVIKVGTSIAVVIPKYYSEELGIQAGDNVSVTLDPKKGIFHINPKINKATKDKEILDWSRKFIKKYRPALEALAKK